MPHKKGKKLKRCKSSFKPGHQYHARKPSDDEFVEEEAENPKKSTKNYQRLTRDIYELGFSAKPDQPTSILRPTKANKSPLEGAEEDVKKSEQCTGYRIISINKLVTFMSTVGREHHAHSPGCMEELTIPCWGEQTQGLGTSLHVHCPGCGYTSSRHKLYNTIKKSERGRPCVDLNVAMGNFMLDSSISYRDVTILFTLLDCNTISERGLKKATKNVAPILEKIGNDEIDENIKKLKTIISHQEEADVGLSTDTMYNNPSKGGAHTGNGTQASTPVFETTTKKSMILHVGVDNQLCYSKEPGSVECSLNHKDCAVSIPPGETLSSTESKTAEEAILKLEEEGIKVTSFLSDRSHQVMAGVKRANPSIEKLDDIVHYSRSQKKQFYKYTYSEQLLGKSKKEAAKNRLADIIRDRCSAELKVGRWAEKDEKKFLLRMEMVRQNIAKCLRGNHEHCRKHSYVCRGKRHTVLFNGMRNLNMTEEDMINVQEVIDYRLNAGAVTRQRKVLNTNKVEAHHNRVLRLCPKHKTQKRTLRARNLNAALIDSIGVANSILKVGRSLGLKFSRHAVTSLSRMERQMNSENVRQKSIKFIRNRYKMRLKKLKLKAQAKTNKEKAFNVPIDHQSY